MRWNNRDESKLQYLLDIYDNDEDQPERVMQNVFKNLDSFVDKIKDPAVREKLVDRITQDFKDCPEHVETFLKVQASKDRLRKIHGDYSKYIPKKTKKVVVETDDE